MLKKLSSKFINLMIVVSLLMVASLGNSINIDAESSNANRVTLNGLVDQSSEGFINSKAVMVGDTTTTIKYNLTPNWLTGSAFRTRVYIQLPSLNYVDGEYVRAENQGQVGIKGTVVEGGGWRVIGDKESNGGLITMEYTGALSPGNNPSFDITLSTYTDDDNLNIPEGTNMELRGYVSYQNFDGNEGMAWETPGKSDENAIITVVVSNLKWDAYLDTVLEEGETVDTVPLWDRYQYISYDYSIVNTSDNIESNIDGFTTTFIIDSEGTELNGIIPFDINRFSYIDGKAVPNTDPDLTEGLFVGVPGEGGILIYDITDTDELETPLPYIYSGTGMIEIGRPDLKVGAKEHRQYRIILPLSRQGFPSVPTFFKISTITNISLGGGINWTKTDVNQREIVDPTFEMTMNHTTKEKDVIYGYETYFQITDINNKSNVPIFDPIVKYHQDPDFKVKSVRFTLPKDQEFKDSLHDTFLSYTNDKGEEITHNIPSSYSEDDTSIFFSIDIKDFKSNLVIHLKSEFAKREKTDIDIKIFGEPNRVGELTHTAELVFIEKQASNDEFGENTTYTDVPHYVEIDSTINVIFPEEVKAQLSMGINSSKVQDKNDIYQGTGKYDEAVVLDYYFGTNNEAAESSVFEAVLNNEYAIHNPEITLKKELFDSASDIKLYIIDENDVKKLIIYTYEDEDLTIKINEKVKKVIVETKEFKTDGESHLVSIKGTLNKGLKKTHEISASFSTYQPLPYDKVDTEKVDGLIEIELPNELKPTNQINVKYGSSKSNFVSYESIFDVDFNLNTLGVNSPKASYTIDLLTPSKKGFFEIQNITFDETYVESYIAYDIDGASYENQLPYDKTLVKIEVKLNNFKTSAAVTLVQMQIKAQIDMGSSQDIRAVFKGNQEAPYPDDVTVNATEKVTVFDTKTSVTVKGVNQVNENLGASNKYSVDIHRYWYYNYANNVNDYTLDQGYKSLGGFTTSMVRPTQKYANNDQTLTLSAQLPNHFDMYYLKIRDDVKDYITTVNIYRTINGKEVLWQSIDGSQWVNNTQEGNFWRINTAHEKNSGEALFSTHQDSKTVDEHPYFKDAWHEDVRPESPVTKVDVILDFNRISNDDAPQLSGETNDVIEYMGRFHTTSKKREATPFLSLDEFGLVETQERGHSHTINSLVGYPYAQTSTGAHDNTTLARKQVLMGTVGEYKASIQNMETHTDPYYRGQGPDIYTPVATEHNEWLHMRNSGFFHDTLIYEFLYPTRVSQDPVYNYQSEYFVIENTPVNKYLDQIIVYGENNSVVTIDKIDFEGAVKVNYVDGLTPGYEIANGEINLTLGKDISPLKFEAYFKQIQGFGEKTAEIDGNVQDTLGALALVDIRVGGVVNGDKDLTGTTNLYRLPDDSKAKTRVHTSSAVLSGITPKLNGQISMKFDEVKVYDYGKDGVTPNKTTIEYDLVNRGEADITDIVMTLTPDQNFRTQEIKIPKEIFDGDYSVDTVRIEGKDVASHFVLKGDYYILDLLDLFDKGILKQSSYKRGTITYNKLDTRKIEVSFISNTDDARLYGQFTKNENNDQTLSSRMIEGSYVFVSGVWADQSTSGLWDWDSTPTYVTEGTKARSEVITSYSSFDITAEVTSKQSIYVSSGAGNQGQKPRLVHKSSSNNSTAPRLYNRGAKLTLYATHLDNDMSTSDNNNLFFDKDTDKQVSYTNLTVGDTNYILYRIHNNGKLAADDISAGDIPVFNPYFELQVPLGLKISSTEVLTDKPTYINDDNFISGKIDEETISDKKYELTLDNTLEYGESVYVLVKLETINDFGSELFASQNKTMRWQAYAKPYKMHAFNSFDVYGSNGYRVTGRNNELMASNYYANTYNSDYRFSNPNKLRIVSIFDVENVSGQDMTLTISNIENETLHSNTKLELFLTLDKNKNQIVSVQGNTHGGFELTAFPTPESMPGYAKPEIYFLHEKTWIKASDFDKNIHDLKAINELKIDYGIVDDNFVAPSFTVSGIGHWKTLGSLSTKNYNIYSTVELVLTHDSNSSYKYITENHKRAHKAIAQTEFNLQAFETLDEANTPYNGALVGKHSYKPGDVFYNKITLKNINNFQGINTNTPYGKADLLNPVIYDKIPEYISIDDVEIRILDSEGNVRTHIAPVIKESTIEGLDVGGMQTFANDRHNDSFGLLSSAEPADTHKNEAEKITYKLIEYHFEEEDLKRGEVLEIVYKTTVRKEGLPYAMYPDGRAVYAPLLGWYTNNTPNASLNQNYTMDMASLLHDVGLSGNKGHELTENEFLSNSSSWTHGSLRKRRLPSNTSLTQDTYYDESANKQVTHQTWLKEEKDNTLYVSFTGAKDEVFDYLTKARVNDNKVLSPERILWTQNGMQLQRAWLYGASEFRPDNLRLDSKVDGITLEDKANFYEHDGNLNDAKMNPANNYGHTPYAFDDYTYAVQLHEIFTSRLHAANLGDRSIESGIQYTYILPIGISPFDENGNLLGIATKGDLAYEYEIVQTPKNDKGYRAPKQSQEAGSYKTDTRDEVPYVIVVKIKSPLNGAFNTVSIDNKQYVDLKLRVEFMIDANGDLGVNKNLSILHDELTVTPIGKEEYLEVYSKEYGAYTRSLSHSYSQNSKYYQNDAVSEGLDLEHSWVSSSSYLSFEPYGMYIRGLNAQNTRVYDDANKLTGLVIGDQLALRKPTLRTWVKPEKSDKKDARYGNIDDFDLNLYDELKLHTTIENQQLEVLQGYNRKYYQYTGSYANEDLWKNTPQTIGGARGAYFEPVVKMVLPIGVAPLGKDGKALRLYDNVLNQDIDFEAAIHDITGLHKTTLNKDVTDKFDVKVMIEEGKFVLVFTVNEEKSVDIQYLQTLIISPLVKVIDNIEGNVEIIANSARESFNPMVSDQYKTGSVPSTSQRDTHTIVTSITGKPIAENDRLRPDSTSTWKSNMGVLKITEPLIKETKLTDDGVKGELELKVRQASIKNTSKTLRHPTSAENDTSQVDPAGKHWYLTEVNNDIIKHENPYEESHTAGDVHHSRFVFTYLITNFARVTEEVRIKIGNEVFKPEDIGYTVDYILSEPYEKDDKRMRVQFVVTPPEGKVLSQESFKFLFEVILIDGFTDDVLGNDEVWTGENLKADSYVSLITDDKTVSKNDPRDFIIQDESLMNYTQHIQDSDLKVNMNGDDKVVDYAHDDSAIEIIKPKVIVRKNTQRPRIEYTSGQTGDNYYNSSDDIIYAINHLENTGAALKEMVMEDILPTDSKTESSIDITRLPITTQARTVSTGIWHIPQEMVDIIAADGKNLHDIYKVYVYASTEDAIDGYEAEGWTLLNDGGTNIDTNEVLTLDRATRKIRVVLKTLDHENYLIPKGTKLAIDTDPSTPELESVLESDPDNLNVKDMSDEVFASSIQITMRALSDASSTLFIYNNAQAWANYVVDAVLKLDQSSVRSYLTPSRPVLNVEYDAKNFRIIGEDENDDFIYGWSDNTNINPHQLPHLKFKTTFTNADESMWSEDEKHIYAKDLLIDPFVSFELPNVMASLQGKLDYIETVGKDSPLNEDYVNKQGLLNSDNGKWTWYLEKKDGSQSELEIDDFYTGSWNGFSNNVLNIWFKGNVEPGDKIIVEFIGAITFFAVPEKGDLQSKAKISNNTGLLTPLNSKQNRSNKLGYTVDSYDLDRNNSTSNRLVFQDKNLFTYENVDNFKKSKKSISELNLAGTEYPELTPMKQNGVVKFDITIDNSQLQENRTYPYPIFYDVLPHVGDTSIFNPSEARNSKFNALLLTDTIQLEIEGSENKIFTDKDYTSYIGPFKKTGTTIEKVDLPQGAETEKFYDDLGVPGKASAYRDTYFVTLADFNKYAKGREHEIESILALFNNTAYEMPANSKIRLNYDMKSLINAPVMLDETLNPSDYAILNSFSATQRVLGFKPQESNLAGAYTTELKENSYFGGYIWHDYNINGVQDEGTLWTDSNGRQLLKPDDKDYGINDVVVTLQTDTGYDVDAGGFAIKQDTDNEWYVVDEATGDFLIDEVFLEKILSSGPTITHTQMDYHGNAGYYVFSNIPKRKYKVVYEFDSQYDKYGQTTQITKEINKNGLISLIEDLDLTQAYTDEELMNFDIGIAQQILLGGNVFLENERIVSGIEEQFNGIKDKDELGIENSEISLKDIDGNILKDINGNPYITHTDDKGDYEFVITPLMRNAYLSITVYPNDPVKQKSTVISPVRINTDPFLSSDDNDGYYVRSDRETRSDNLSFALDELYDEDFADRTSVYFGFYERSNTATIGDKVWDDLNQNGIQDIGETGIEHQELWLHQYALIDDKYELITEDFMSTKTNASGLYYFRKVPTMVEVSGIDYPAYYKVSLKNLVKGYNISLNNQGSIEIDNNFLLNGLTLDDDFIEIIGKDEDGNYDEYEPIDVNNIDLGLHKHQLGSLSGSLFEDTNKDGYKNDTSNLDAYPGFIINLEVKDKNGAWIKAQADENDQMLEPGIKGKDIQTFGKEYNFENLMIVNPEIKADGSYERFEYRIVISQVPQWFEPTPQTLGGDLTINNDFKERDILNNNFRTLETETITLKVSKSDDSMVAVDTFVAVSIENVDFALAPLIKTRDISGILWVDGIVYDAILQENIIDLDKRDGILDSDEHLRLSDTSVYLYRKDVDKKVLRPVVDADGNHIQTLTDAQGYYEFKGLDLADYDKADPNSDTFDPNWKYYNQAIEYVVSFNRKTRHESTLYAVDANLLDSDFIQLSKVDEEKEYTDLDKAFSLYNKDGSKISIDQHMLVSNVGLLANKNGGKVDYYNTQNVSLNAGVIEHDTIKEISGTLFEDLDKNGVQDINTEKSIKDIQVSLHVFDYTSNKWIAKLDDKGKAMQVKTDENGNYSFEVEVADMNINSDHYQKVYRYRVVSEPRFANQELVYRYTLDKQLNARFEYIDEPLQGLEPDNLYTDLVSKEITLAAEKDGLVDLSSIYDEDRIKENLSVDAGFALYKSYVNIGGRLWHEERPEDGQENHIRDDHELAFVNQKVFLYRKVGTQWFLTEDLNGNSSMTTDKDGYYEFKVAPTSFTADDKSTWQYRVATKRDAWQKFADVNQGTDLQIDSNFLNAYDLTTMTSANALWGVSQIFDIADTVDGVIDMGTTRTDLTMDAGISTYQKTAKLGGIVSLDLDETGIRNVSQIPVVKEVTLWKFSQRNLVWEKIETVNSDEFGYYEFEVFPTNFDPLSNDYLKPYAYRVSAQREGYQAWTLSNQGSDISKDSNISNADDLGLPGISGVHTGVTEEFDIYDGLDIKTITDDLDMGIGYVEFPDLVRLSGKVWRDTNFDGIKQDEELGETDREVTLWKQNPINSVWEHVDTTLTTTDGYYSFMAAPTSYDQDSLEYLLPYTYRINVKRSSNEVFSPYLQGTDITSDSNIEDLDLTGKTLSASSDNFDINELVNGKVNIAKVKADNNMGVGIKTFETSAILGGTVWKDSTYDGYMSTYEERLAGRSVTLWKREGKDWKEHKDLNGNSTVVTNELGQYEFKVSPTNYNPLDVDYLSPYKYRISIERGANEAFSRPRNVSNDPLDETDSNIELRDFLAKDLVGFSHEFTIYDVVNGKVDITSIRDDKTIGAGINVYDNLVLIGGKVWDDSDFDGIMSHDEAKIENQPITLWIQELDGRWTDINETMTDENGNYIFTAVPAEYDTNSDHYLSPFVYKVSTPRKGNESFSSYKEGTDSTRDSNVNDTIDLDGNKVYEHIGISDAFSIIDVINLTGKVDISSVRDDMDMGIGIKKNPDMVTLGGTVWHDLDEDGIMLDDEVRIADREVILQELIDNAWVDIDSVLTNEDGEYRFENIAPTYYDFNSPNYLVPRSYRITFTRNGYEVFSPMNVGTDNTVDSDIDAQAMFIQNHIGISNTFKIFEAVNGKVDVNTIRDDIHMGVGLNVYKNTALIGGVLWNDNNRNGLKDADEALIENKEVELWRYEPVDPKNPKGEGRWVLTEDVKGNHTVLTDELGQYEFEVLPTNYDNTADDYLHVYTYIALVKRSGDQVWTLYELENGIDSDNYFDNIEALKGYSQNDLPKDAGYGLTNVFDIVDYDEDYIIDINSVRDISMMDGGLFIYNNLAQIGDKVWHDINENGIQDHNESGIKDVVVKLQQYNTATGTWFNIYDEQGLDSYVTQRDGKYLFTVQAADLDLDSDTYLSEHQYRVMIEIPNGMEATIMHNDELLNSDHISQDGMLLTSRNAKVFASTDDGLIENTEVMDDLDIDFGLVLVKDGSTKVPTGESYSILLPSLLVLTVGILSIVIIKRKEELEQED